MVRKHSRRYVASFSEFKMLHTTVWSVENTLSLNGSVARGLWEGYGWISTIRGSIRTCYVRVTVYLEQQARGRETRCALMATGNP